MRKFDANTARAIINQLGYAQPLKAVPNKFQFYIYVGDVFDSSESTYGIHFSGEEVDVLVDIILPKTLNTPALRLSILPETGETITYTRPIYPGRSEIPFNIAGLISPTISKEITEYWNTLSRLILEAVADLPQGDYFRIVAYETTQPERLITSGSTLAYGHGQRYFEDLALQYKATLEMRDTPYQDGSKEVGNIFGMTWEQIQAKQGKQKSPTES